MGQHAAYSGNTRAATQIEAADPTFHLTQSHYTDVGPTSFDLKIRLATLGQLIVKFVTSTQLGLDAPEQYNFDLKIRLVTLG